MIYVWCELGMETEYNVMPEPKTPIDEEIIEESKKINLEALYDGADPFAGINLISNPNRNGKTF